jgi:hypothetical protein
LRLQRLRPERLLPGGAVRTLGSSRLVHAFRCASTSTGHFSRPLGEPVESSGTDTRDEAEIKQTVRKLVLGGFLVGGREAAIASMAHISGFAREHLLRMPRAVDGYVTPRIRSDSSTPLPTLRTLRRRGLRGSRRRRRAGRSAEALHLRPARPPRSQTKRGQELRRQSPLFCAFSSLSRNANASLADCSVTSGSYATSFQPSCGISGQSQICVAG